MKVFARPVGLHSRAMVRVCSALAKYAPRDGSFEIVETEREADVVVIHAIGRDTIKRAIDLLIEGKKYVVIQYCYLSSGGSPAEWAPVWRNAELVWSYYDLSGLGIPNFYRSPLGVDPAFVNSVPVAKRPLVVTSGYVSSPCGEPIEEVWLAAARLGLEAVHIGPQNVAGMAQRPDNWVSREGISDDELAALLSSASWVSALRHVEGFEMPAVEGLACRARPIAFDQPSMRFWYGDLVRYVDDQAGEKLIDQLCEVMAKYSPVGERERDAALAMFDWEPIIEGFWASMGRAS